MTPSNVARSILQGGNVTTHQTCAGSQRQSVTHSLPPLWFLVTSRTVSTDLQLFTLASSFPSSEESNAEDGTSRKLTGLAILLPQNVLFRWFLSTSALRNHTSVSVVPCRKQPTISFHGMVYSVFGWGVPRFTEAVRRVWWLRHSWPSHRVTRCSLPALLGRTDVEDELHALKPEELGTDTMAWCCSTITQVNTFVSQHQCRCRSSHPGC